MPAELAEEKGALRRQMAARIAAMPAAEKARASRDACELLQQTGAWQIAASVILYAPLPDELDVWGLAAVALKTGKQLGLPAYDRALARYTVMLVRSLDRDLVRGRYGIREPAPHCESLELNPLDLLVVPGIAFDLHGRRLGRGKGYYDRLLSQTLARKCGAAFDPQIVPQVPIGPHDVFLNCISTPTRWVEC